LYINPNLTQVEILSTGRFSRESRLFRGYKNIFGLDKQNQSTLNYVIILPELQKFVNKYLEPNNKKVNTQKQKQYQNIVEIQGKCPIACNRTYKTQNVLQTKQKKK
jgi:hypothetical protein